MIMSKALLAKIYSLGKVYLLQLLSLMSQRKVVEEV